MLSLWFLHFKLILYTYIYAYVVFYICFEIRHDILLLMTEKNSKLKKAEKWQRELVTREKRKLKEVRETSQKRQRELLLWKRKFKEVAMSTRNIELCHMPSFPFSKMVKLYNSLPSYADFLGDLWMTHRTSFNFTNTDRKFAHPVFTRIGSTRISHSRPHLSEKNVGVGGWLSHKCCRWGMVVSQMFAQAK